MADIPTGLCPLIVLASRLPPSHSRTAEAPAAIKCMLGLTMADKLVAVSTWLLLGQTPCTFLAPGPPPPVPSSSGSWSSIPSSGSSSSSSPTASGRTPSGSRRGLTAYDRRPPLPPLPPAPPPPPPPLPPLPGSAFLRGRPRRRFCPTPPVAPLAAAAAAACCCSLSCFTLALLLAMICCSEPPRSSSTSSSSSSSPNPPAPPTPAAGVIGTPPTAPRAPAGPCHPPRPVSRPLGPRPPAGVPFTPWHASMTRSRSCSWVTLAAALSAPDRTCRILLRSLNADPAAAVASAGRAQSAETYEHEPRPAQKQAVRVAHILAHATAHDTSSSGHSCLLPLALPAVQICLPTTLRGSAAPAKGVREPLSCGTFQGRDITLKAIDDHT